jgi:hypothetical protein
MFQSHHNRMSVLTLYRCPKKIGRRSHVDRRQLPRDLQRVSAAIKAWPTSTKTKHDWTLIPYYYYYKKADSLLKDNAFQDLLHIPSNFDKGRKRKRMIMNEETGCQPRHAFFSTFFFFSTFLSPSLSLSLRILLSVLLCARTDSCGGESVCHSSSVRHGFPNTIMR